MTRRASLLDLSVGIVICGVLLSLMTMSVAWSRTLARGRFCDSNLKQLGLAIHNYHAAYKRLPYGAGGTDQGGVDSNDVGNAGRLSALVGLLPFYEQQQLWEKISNPFRRGDQTYPPMGPEPWHDPKQYPPFGMRPEVLTCPEDGSAAQFPLATSYVLNYGDGIYQVGNGKSDWPSPRDRTSLLIQQANCRGVFAKQTQYGFRDILDGLSNTVMLSEMQINGTKVARNVANLAFKPSLAIKAQDGNDFWPAGRQSVWCDGGLRSAGFQSVLPPGSPSATSNQGETTAVMSASSHHGSGAHALMCDGSVVFISSSIDSGNADAPSVSKQVPGEKVAFALPGSRSPYGLWGALGTRASGEIIEEKLGDSNATSPPRQPIDPSRLAELKKQPVQTFQLTGGKPAMKGWLQSCSRDGKLVIIGADGKEKRLTLADLTSENAYSIVQAGLVKKMESRKLLLPQLKEGLSLLERKKFSEFLDRFVDKQNLLDFDQVAELSQAVFKQRGLLIQAFDDAILAVQSPVMRVIEADETGMLIGFPDSRRSQAPLILRYRDGRWYVTLDPGARRRLGRIR